MVDLFDKWNEMVIATVPKERLLVFNTGVDGWEKLCTALNVSIPTKDYRLDNGSVVPLPLPYPHLNTGQDYRSMVLAQKALAVMFVSTPILLCVMIGLCVYKQCSRRAVHCSHLDRHQKLS